MHYLGLLLAVGIILLVMTFYFSTSTNPAAQADNIRTSVKPGMTWDQVAEIREPRKYFPIDYNRGLNRGSPNKFDRTRLADSVRNQSYQDGFFFEYKFSGADEVRIYFDVNGVVTGEVEDQLTEKDLLKGNIFKE